MNFLTPLYFAGALAVALPIIFHLIRRTPQKKQIFSSLMFLSPSPPRLTRRSRLSDILLLILRGGALILLALAFARPFFYRQADKNLSGSQGKRIALMVDTSASMRRGDLWTQAGQQVDRVLADVKPEDEVALFLFDRTLTPAFTFDQWNQLDFAHRAPMLRARLTEASPSWSSTNLGEALAAVANQMAESRATEKYADLARRQIVLVSDLQQGAHVDALQGHEWPENVLLDVRAVETKLTTNASLAVVKAQTDATDKSSIGKLRVRVANQPNSTAEQFTLAWANERGVLPTLQPQKVYVAPGLSQVVRIDWPPADSQVDRLILSGDDFDFDNTLYLVHPQQAVSRVLYVGADDGSDPKEMGYYVQSAVAGDSAQRKVDFVERRPVALTEADLLGTPMIVIASPPADERIAALRKLVESGGSILWVVTDPAGAPALSRLAGVDVAPVIEASETTSHDFSLISRIDTDNPVFAAFSDPRFADFTKIHFWKHRRVQFHEDASAPRMIASFDNGDPFLFEKRIGQGRLLIAAAGWNPADSQLALSTKFVPLINGMLEQPRGDSTLSESQYTIGDALPLPKSGSTGVSPVPTTSSTGETPALLTAATDWDLLTPDNRHVKATGANLPSDALDRPGIYKLQHGSEQFPLAVNVSPDESRTMPLTTADLEQWGAKVGEQAPAPVLEARQRQLKLFELENRQKMWRWLILAVLGLVAVETVLAGRLARRGSSAAMNASGTAPPTASLGEVTT